MKRICSIFFIMLVLLASCSPEKRVARIAKRYNLQTVTEYVTDTVIIPARVRTDTVMMYNERPVVIDDEKFTTEIVRVTDTVFVVKTTLKPDTIVKSVPVEKYVIQEKVKSSVGLEIFKIVVFFFFALGLFIFALILYRLWGK